MKLISSSIWRSMRPKHWIKNLFVFAPLFFSGEAKDPVQLISVVLVFLSFNFLSSSIYFFNDLVDRERDRNHPEKCKRPIASGDLSARLAMIAGIFLAIFSILVALFINFQVVMLLVIYGGMNIAYSLWLKHVVILDVFCIALGFVLRILGGSFAINIIPTSWLIIATFLLALFLGLAKRRNEMILLSNSSNGHRPVLYNYTTILVDQLISVITPVTLITYLLYTLDPETISRWNTNILFVTGIFVIFGIFRYLYLVHRKNWVAPQQILL